MDTVWIDGVVGVFTGPVAPVPAEYALSAPYPNPFNSSFRVNFDLPEPVFVQMMLYDVLGRQFALILNETRQAGSYSYVWEPSDLERANLSSGAYFLRFQAGGFSQTRRIIYLK